MYSLRNRTRENRGVESSSDNPSAAASRPTRNRSLGNLELTPFAVTTTPRRKSSRLIITKKKNEISVIGVVTAKQEKSAQKPEIELPKQHPPPPQPPVVDHRVFTADEKLALELAIPHPDGKKMSCGKCHKLLGSKSTLSSHAQSVHGEKCHKCEFCCKRFARKDYHTLHLKKWHLKSEACSICGTTCAGIAGLQKHKKDFHSSPVQEFPCLHCGIIFRVKEDLAIHRSKIHKGIHCSVCGKVFQGIEGLKSHYSIFHRVVSTEVKNPFPSCSKDDGLFRCKFCPGTFTDETVLKSHHDYFHQKLKCKLCGSELHGQGQLFFHLKETHEPDVEISGEGVLSYVCPICPDSQNHFPGRDSYLDHYAETHVSTTKTATITMTTVSDFQLTSCLYCTHLAPNQRYMRRHIDIAHPHKREEEELLQQQQVKSKVKVGSGKRAPILKRNVTPGPPKDSRRTEGKKMKVDKNGNVIPSKEGKQLKRTKVTVGAPSFVSGFQAMNDVDDSTHPNKVRRCVNPEDILETKTVVINYKGANNNKSSSKEKANNNKNSDFKCNRCELFFQNSATFQVHQMKMHNTVVGKRLRKWNRNLGLAVLKPMNFDFIKDMDEISQ